MDTTKKIQASSIDEYIRTFPPETRRRLMTIRDIIRTVSPEAKEAIKYGIPTFILDGNLVHFGGFTHHIGLYPTPDAIAHFAQELTPYTTNKGSIQFPASEPLPLALIKKIVMYRVEQTKQKRTARSS